MNKLIILRSLIEGKNVLQVLVESKPLDEGLKNWAVNELKLAGFYDEDSDYKGMLGPAIEEILDVFCRQEHSGGSAGIVIEVLEKLLRWEPLTPCDHSDYNDVSEMAGKPLLQCRRCAYMFSEDGGKNWYDVREK